MRRFKQRISSGIAGILGWMQRGDLPSVKREEVPFTGEVSNVRLFLGTKTGLMYYDGQRLWRLFSGRVYGITKYDDRWYTTWNHAISLCGKPLGTMASIISFRFEDEQITDLRADAAPLDQEVHQIDVWDACLHVTDTAKNRVLVYRIGEDRLHAAGVQYPNGKLKEGKQSPNYAHINSIFHRNGHTYLVYHNQTRKTGRRSEVAVLGRDWQVQEIVSTKASCAHNVVLDGKGIVYCDSMNGRFVSNGKVLFEADVYLRGLAATSNCWLVGGSAFSERDKRNITTGYLYQCDRPGIETLREMRIPGCGSVYEIRIVGERDFALSGYESDTANSCTAQQTAVSG